MSGYPETVDATTDVTADRPRTETVDGREVHRLGSVAELRELIGDPTALVCMKVADSLNELSRAFVERSPFVCIATSSPDGDCDVSPRGDPVGFVRILDDRTLVVPERPGNRLADTLRNIIDNPRVGLLFIMPGIGDTFRVNGRAWITDDPELLAPSAHEGIAPRLGIVVHIEQAFTQCSKAFIRSQLWDPSSFQDRATLPSNGEILKVIQAERHPDFDAAAYDVERANRYARREGFY